ncbi:hypothetical protein QEH52_17125 [Coraliomargarita sp. SDUM461003]|uniref:Uncharacterized protein n=1 Tax=Thalassobacterium maritimum TaxID=3041265 RepID=A0ABU1B018_9BACT|nr:hypothetical protein [Coraliomargarita sp. SDUM461003]MDQ8209252.1 hypothetical protein [Coraliomargarita sp. SDUM461003]
MSDRDSDSPFADPPNNRLVWIVPSVLLHLVVLVVWLLLPDEAPRERPDRELTINSRQAQQLQQHVEDANLKVLRAQVEELQTIKLAMSEIRDRKMAQLREFEKRMVVNAPRESFELFTRLLSSQSDALAAHKKLLELRSSSEQLTETLQPSLKIETAKELIPQLQELQQIWADGLEQTRILTRETAQALAMMNTAENQLAWLRDESVADEFAQLRKLMESAQYRNQQVVYTVKKGFSGNPSKHLNDLLQRHDQFLEWLQTYNLDLVEGPKKVEGDRQAKRDEMERYQQQLHDFKLKRDQLIADQKALPQDASKTQRAALTTQLNKLRENQRKTESHLKNAERSLKGIRDFRPNKSRQDQLKRVRGIIDGIFASAPDVDKMQAALETQVAVIQAMQALLEALPKQVKESEGAL